MQLLCLKFLNGFLLDLKWNPYPLSSPKRARGKSLVAQVIPPLSCSPHTNYTWPFQFLKCTNHPPHPPPWDFAFMTLFACNAFLPIFRIPASSYSSSLHVPSFQLLCLKWVPIPAVTSLAACWFLFWNFPQWLFTDLLMYLSFVCVLSKKYAS